MNTKEHLPLMGVGPIYVILIVGITIIGILLSKTGKLNGGKITLLHTPFVIVGITLIVLGVIIWLFAYFQSDIDNHIKSNTLATTGIYAHVRNPLYCAFILACDGALLIASNYYLLVLPIIYWIFITVLMKCTEEKWLLDLYGKQYEEYCKHVNRCIPWF